ncbi:hypothetical protein F4778DRAFT_744599 [Xylariomycetidae sp. FL2044]|nr:hypothetical protein F4778DRAFT_744599 [Xylariomycetidae sp. FL2044]
MSPLSTSLSFKMALSRSPPLMILSLLGFSLCLSSASASVTSQFQDFYPQHGHKYEYVLHHNCSQEFANYLTGQPQDFPLDWLGGGGEASRLTQPVIQCLLDNTSEFIKAAAASAQVLLGITPSILALLGASTDELGMLTVVGRRPLLALILSIGSPSVYLDRPFESREPTDVLQRYKGQYRLPRPTSALGQWTISLLQYALALASAANIATLNWQLGVRCVCSFWTETTLAPMLWGILSIPIYFAGTLALRLRMQRVYNNEAKDRQPIGFAKWIRLLPYRLLAFCRSEWIPSICQDDIRIVTYREGKTWLTWTWLLSTCTVIHVLFGTLLLSSLLFLGPQDALGLIIRYMASVLVCRVILMFEIAGMRERYNPEPDDSAYVEVAKTGEELLRMK